MRTEAARVTALYLGITVGAWAADAWSKAWALKLVGGARPVPDLLEFWVFRNHGAALGLGSSLGQIPLIGAMVVMMVLLGIWAWRTDVTKTMRHFGFACMIGGATGNLTDRLVRGFVVDFIQILGSPVFNLADAAVLFGIALVILDVALEEPDSVASQ